MRPRPGSSRRYGRMGSSRQPISSNSACSFWSTQLTVPTDRGLFWFKENNPDQAFEAGLVAELADIVPDRVVIPLATRSAPRLDAVSGPRPDHVRGTHESGRDVWATDGPRVRRSAAPADRPRGSPAGNRAHQARADPRLTHSCGQRSSERQARPSTDPRHVETLTRRSGSSRPPSAGRARPATRSPDRSRCRSSTTTCITTTRSSRRPGNRCASSTSATPSGHTRSRRCAYRSST